MIRCSTTGKTVPVWIVLPVVLYAIAVMYINNTGPFFLRSVDPEYAYLLNGLLLADFKPDVAFITNPGTPVQCLVALVIRAVHLFRPGIPLADDVLQNPELYIKASLYFFAAIQAGAVFALGCCTYRFSGSIPAGILMQMTPFTHLLTLEVLGRMMPESLMNAIVCMWLILLIKKLHQPESERNDAREALVFGLLFGLGLANKLTFLPYLLLPLAVLRGLKSRIMFALFAVLSFAFFAFPAVINHRAFSQWVMNMFTHTGAYGSGEPGFFKWNEFSEHLQHQLQHTRLLWILVLVLLTVTAAGVIRSGRTASALRFRIAVGLILVIAVQYLMASKQFAYHYMIPSILLTAFIVYLLVLHLKEVLPGQAASVMMILAPAVFGVLLLFMVWPASDRQLKQIREAAGAKMEAYKQVAPYLEGNTRIISPAYYGCPAIEYALTYGLHESGRYGTLLYERITALYPAHLMYLPWGNVFYLGNKGVDPSVFVRPGRTYTLYMAEYSEEKLKRLLAAIEKDGAVTVRPKKLYQSAGSGDVVFSLQVADGYGK